MHRVALGDVDRPIEDPFLHASGLRRFQFRLGIDLLENARNADEYGRSDVAKIVRYLIHRLGEKHRHTVEDVEIHRRSFEYMSQRQNREGYVVDREIEFFERSAMYLY